MRTIVTGAAGLVGHAVMQHYNAIALSHADLDITDRESVAKTISRLRPDLIVNCAVLGVDECEHDPRGAQAINVDGPAALAEAAETCGASIVHFSSNYVFAGDREVFYTVDDQAVPVNVYGKTKLAGERAVVARCTRAFIIRSSWIFGPGKGSFISTVHQRLMRGERVRAVSDVWASTTYLLDLVQRLAEIVSRRKFGTHHVVNDGVCSNESFAREAASIVGADETLIEAVSTREAHDAPRPRYTPLLALPPLRHWRGALRAYIESPP